MAGSLPSDEYFMRRCIDIARNGELDTAPNPSVGAVIVYEGRILGEGYTAAYGGPHGEVNAFNAVRPEDEHLLPDSTLYVTLEPCSHFGKTPPCCDLIIRKKVRRVVIGAMDSNPLVGGKGAARLREQGIEVISGILEKACRDSNKKFFTAIEKKRPFITLKWAQSAEGHIARQDASPVAISNALTQRYTHRLRATHMGILCGWKTVHHDRPALNNRYWAGKSPQVIILDLNRHLDNDPHLETHHEWWRITGTAGHRPNDLEVEKAALPEILSFLLGKGIQSILVEGGASTHQSFIDNQLWDECIVYKGRISIPEGIPAAICKGQLAERFCLEDDIVEIYIP